MHGRAPGANIPTGDFGLGSGSPHSLPPWALRFPPLRGASGPTAESSNRCSDPSRKKLHQSQKNSSPPQWDSQRKSSGRNSNLSQKGL